MTWSYSGDPRNSRVDEVRFLVGDTNVDDQLLTDEEILFMIDTERKNIFYIAATVAETIAGKFSRAADKSVGDLRISYSQLQENYLGLAKNLRRRGMIRGTSAYAGGISRSDKRTRQLDEDRVKPAVRRRMHDAPGTETGEDDEEKRC